jgi:hypothetical protein
MPAFSEHPCHAALKGIMDGLFERPVAKFALEPQPVPPNRSAPLSTFRLGKGKEAQRAVYDSNDDNAKSPGREEWKPDNLHCKGECVVEYPHQDRKNETQDLDCGKRDNNKWGDEHIIDGTAKAAFLGPRRVTTIGHGGTSGQKTADRAGSD